MLGSAALLAATAVKNYLAARGVRGRVRYYGCPAEEGGAAKVVMVRAGHFEDVDIAITWLAAAINRIDDATSLANTRLDFTFKGRASHAAAAPHLGRSALDAVALMNVGVNYMREQMPSDARIHYAMLDGGGVAPNVVQATAKVRFAGARPRFAGHASTHRARAEGGRWRRHDDRDAGGREGRQRRLEPARQHTDRASNAAADGASGSPALRCGGSQVCGRDPSHADAGGHCLSLRARAFP